MSETSKGNQSLIAKSKAHYKGFPRWLKGIIISFIVFIILLIIGWFVIAWYIDGHKKELLAKITAEVSDNVDGNFHIDDMEPALLNSFPNISVRLKGVTLSDSLY